MGDVAEGTSASARGRRGSVRLRLPSSAPAPVQGPRLQGGGGRAQGRAGKAEVRGLLGARTAQPRVVPCWVDGGGTEGTGPGHDMRQEEELGSGGDLGLGLQ